MSNLLTFNLCSLFNLLPTLFFWQSRSFHSSHLLHLAITLSANPALCAYLIEPSTSHWVRLGNASRRVIREFCILIPFVLATIYLNCVYIQKVQFINALYHAIILSALVLLPVDDHSMLNLIFCRKSEKTIDSDTKKTNNFTVGNFLVLFLASWYASMAYGMDKNIEIANYP
ncbi:hypothetical protein BLOT_016428, partial [Blomia tropicalis]